MVNDSTSGMTKLMRQYATGGNLTLPEARQKLQADAYIRTAYETLTQICKPEKNDPMLIKKRLVELLSHSDPSAKKESIDRKVRLWLNNKTQYISKESAIQVVFALHLQVQDAEEILWRLCGESFHWRNPQDIVWCYALEQGLNYSEACSLWTRMEPMYLQSKGVTEEHDTLTIGIRQQIVQIQTEKELADFLAENASNLGVMHNTAYNLFMSFMDLLKTAYLDDKLPQARKMPTSEILATYLYNNMIPRAKKAKGTTNDLIKDTISRDIQQNWPDEFALARMANRETDVTRKVLILLFLACDGGETKYGDLSYETPEDVFEDTYARLSSMLYDCGFSPLDSRVAFDWMVLYCMVADDPADIDNNIIQFLSEIFKGSVYNSAD